MKILFLAPYPQDEAPSQRFRFEQYFDGLVEVGHSYKLFPFWSKAAWSILYKPGHKVAKLFYLLFGFMKRWLQVLFLSHQYHYVFIHRETAPIGPPVFEWILVKLFRKKIIYDFDDAIWLPNTSSDNKIASKLKWHKKVKAICKWSWKISCGNEYLVEYAQKWNENVLLNPTTIQTSYHNITNKSKSEKVMIGWTGTHSTLKYLKVLEPVFRKISLKSDVEFLVIADKSPDLDIPFKFIKWTKENEIEDLSKIDIGVMPLSDDIWSKGKCGFKALQYMALGAPTVASPVGVNSKIIDNGINGYLSNNAEQWTDNILSLVLDYEKRILFGAKAREKVEKEYSVDSNMANFLNLFIG